ncbi:beta strand repeat-containing protein, partial [Marinomonas flavescens]|uniref:beta strand repeat-containing protein n=1 Tax=Marinomonas flavescens TaxID=2529379 RepID=UPI00105502B2
VVVEATQNDDGTWSVADADLSTLNDGNVTVTATVTDDAGNTSTTTDTLDLDTSADTDNNFSVTVASSDEITNAGEADSVSVTLGGVDADAQTVKVTFSDGTNNVVVDATQTDGVWSVADADLSDLTDGTITVSAVATDDAGNTSTKTDTLDLDTEVKAPTITIAGDMNEDGVYNAAELGEDGTVTATISVPDDFDATTDTLTINGEEYSLSAEEIAAGKVTVELNPEEAITAQISDAAGNKATTTATAFASVLADTAVTDEDTSVSGNILTNDSDVDNSLAVVSVTVSGDDSTYAVNNDGTDTSVAITQDVTTTGNNGNESTSTVTVGTLVLSADGSYTFTPTDNWNGTVPTITYTTNTGATSTLDITVDAVNDAPVLSVTEGATVTVDDVTAGESSVSGNGYTLTGYSHYLGINEDGTVKGDLTALSTVTGGTNHDGIGVSANTTNGSDQTSEIGSTVTNEEAIVVTFDDEVTSVDASFAWLNRMETATYTFYSNGEEVGTNTFTDGDNTTNSAGTLSITDTDGGLVAFDTIVFTATYDAEADASGSDDNDYLLSSLTFDNLVTTDTLTAIEGGEIISGTVSATDVDNGSVLTYSLVDSEGAPAEAPAGLTFDFDNGTWSFDPKDTEYDSLPVGETATVEAIIQVTDEHGAADTQAITITVTGTNDVAVITGADTGSVKEDTTAQATGTLSVTDTDANEAVF